MTVSMRVMSAGDGYEYLLRTVAAGDGDRSLSTPLTRYYTEEGTPPGFWLGSGLSHLGDGQLAVDGRVSETQLQLLVGMGRDPLTGEPRSEEHTSELQSRGHLVCRLLLEKKKKRTRGRA